MSTTKKSKDVGEHSYKLGDVVLAKIRGYPRWPGMVVDPEAVPTAVAKERPGSKKTTFYCVRFFPAGDYSWAVSKDLSLLQKHEIEAYINEPHKKSGDLLAGYKIALNPTAWEESLEEQRAAQEEAEANAEVDQLEDGDEDEEVEKKSKTSKKRKRESEPKPKKKKEPKKSASAEAKEKKGAAKKKPTSKKNGHRSKETIESEDEGAEDAEGEDVPAESSKKSGPAAKKARKDKGGDAGNYEHLESNSDAARVKEWRHKLQRAFLSKSVPKEEEMPEYDQLFTTIEEHELTIEQLSFSKLGKVMRHIAQLDQSKFPIPNDDEFKIRRRAEVLLDKWQGLIAASGEAGVNASAVNGDTKAEKAEKAEEKAAMELDKAASEVPVNGDTIVDVKITGDPTAVAGLAIEVSAEPPAAEEEVPMDTADD